MPSFAKNEIKRVHINFGGRRGLIRLVHTPTGISVEAPSIGEPIHGINIRLMKELEEKVSRQRNADKP
jgi:hypothetical protein